jgi:hypothetical protein
VLTCPAAEDCWARSGDPPASNIISNVAVQYVASATRAVVIVCALLERGVSGAGSQPVEYTFGYTFLCR